MSALPRGLQLELRETFLFVAEERGLDAAIAAVALLGEQLGRGDRVADELAQVIGAVAIVCGVHLDTILGRDRHYYAAEPRQIAMWVAKRLGYSSPQIGMAIGRCHDVVLRGIKRVNRTPSLLARAERCLQVLDREGA